MATNTTRLNLYKPGGGSSGTILPDEVADIDKINNNMDLLDAAVGAKQVTSTTRPASPFDGQAIRESDTKNLLVYSAAAVNWLPVGVPNVASDAYRNALFTAPAAGDAVYRTDLRALQTYGPNGWEISTAFRASGAAPGFTGTAAVFNPDGSVLATACNSVTLDGIFATARSDSYRIICNGELTTALGISVQLRAAGVASAAGYDGQINWDTASAHTAGVPSNNAASATLAPNFAADRSFYELKFFNPAKAVQTLMHSEFHGVTIATGANMLTGHGAASHRTAAAYDGVALNFNGSFTGTIRVEAL